ncbi:MAG: NAD-binding protein [Myxococcales bacterium]|nr:NAD-binding protein [Myxococcales bacterium]MCB9628863.1 NAD-binding protein [Sandaracinaceae bacterium]
MPDPRIIRPLWQRRALHVLALGSRPGFWARLVPLVSLYALTVYALVNVPSAAAPRGLPRTEALYYAFRFFALDGDGFFPRSADTRQNALMWFVLFADPALALGAVFEVLLRFWRVVQSANARIAAMDAPVVVCGFGTHGRIVAEYAVRAGRDVVIVERNVADMDAMVIEGHRVPVIVGDMTSASVLRAAGAERAEAIWFTAGDPLVNLKAAVVARESVPPERPGTRALVPMVDDDLSEELLVQCVGDRGIEAFRQFDSAAEHLVRLPSVAAMLARCDAAGTSVAIVGFGRFGRAVFRALLAAPACHSSGGDTPARSIVVVDRFGTFRAPNAARDASAAGWSFAQSEHHDAEAWTAAACGQPLTVAFLCTDDDSLNLRCAAVLRQAGGEGIEIVLRMTNPLHEGEQRLNGVTVHSVAQLLRAKLETMFPAA